MLVHRAKDGHTSLPGPWIEKQYHVLGMCVRSFPRLYDFNVQYRISCVKARNHPKISMHLTLNQDTNNWLNCMEFSSGLVKARKIGVS